MKIKSKFSGWNNCFGKANTTQNHFKLHISELVVALWDSKEMSTILV